MSDTKIKMPFPDKGDFAESNLNVDDITCDSMFFPYPSCMNSLVSSNMFLFPNISSENIEPKTLLPTGNP